MSLTIVADGLSDVIGFLIVSLSMSCFFRCVLFLFFNFLICVCRF
jgi:hypothetical protein